MSELVAKYNRPL